MKIINKLMMFSMVVGDMPKAKEFYADKLGCKLATEHRVDDAHWWVSVVPVDGGTSITLTTFKDSAKAGGTMALWFATSDLDGAHKELEEKGVKVNDIKDDLYGPGSGVKWFNFNDPDGNLIHIVQ